MATEGRGENRWFVEEDGLNLWWSSGRLLKLRHLRPPEITGIAFAPNKKRVGSLWGLIYMERYLWDCLNIPRYYQMISAYIFMDHSEITNIYIYIYILLKPNYLKGIYYEPLGKSYWYPGFHSFETKPDFVVQIVLP
jgi:hypothetical protein